MADILTRIDRHNWDVEPEPVRRIVEAAADEIRRLRQEVVSDEHWSEPMADKGEGEKIMTYYTIVNELGVPVVPLDENPDSEDEGMLVYRSREAAQAAADYQMFCYDLEDVRPIPLHALERVKRQKQELKQLRNERNSLKDACHKNKRKWRHGWKRTLDEIVRGWKRACGEKDAEIERLNAERDRLKAAIVKMSHRRCHDCGHVAYYLDATIPECNCEVCGSSDTRRVKEATDV